ncbi:hypothetical protein FAGKG844_360027 [Frankia sp. AgKG'84/4]
MVHRCSPTSVDFVARDTVVFLASRQELPRSRAGCPRPPQAGRRAVAFTAGWIAHFADAYIATYIRAPRRVDDMGP